MASHRGGRGRHLTRAPRSCAASPLWCQHEKRVWSVDFCSVDPTLLVSGSDDGKAKVWSTRDRNSVLDVDIKANVCCVKARRAAAHLRARRRRCG